MSSVLPLPPPPPPAPPPVTEAAPATPLAPSTQAATASEAARAPATDDVVGAARGRAAAGDAAARDRALGGQDGDAAALAAVRRGLQAPREPLRRLDASNIARRDNVQPSLDNTPTPMSRGYEFGPDATDPDRAAGPTTPASTGCVVDVRCPPMDVPSAPTTAAPQTTTPAARERRDGVRRLDASNIARRDNAAQATRPAPTAAGFEPAERR